MDAATPIPPTAMVTLDLPPSCMQFCPLHPGYLVVGTYNLQRDDSVNAPDDEPDAARPRKPQSRNGSLVVFRVAGDQLIKVQTTSQPSALLDLRFHPGPGERRKILAVVSSTGTLDVFRFDADRDASEPLEHLATSRCADLPDDVLFLQCSWHPVVENVIAVSTSTGLARLLHLDRDWKVQAHTDLALGNSLEAWSIAFSPSTENARQAISVYCGGDDSLLRYALCPPDADKPSPPPTEASSSSPVTIRGQHDAGVTAILPLPLVAGDGGRLVVTGSYDDHLRVFSILDLDQPLGAKSVRLLADKNLGGGVWRLGLVDLPSPRTARVLASCMHAGVRLVEISSDDGVVCNCRILSRFEEHKSMNYASDFVPSQEGVPRLRCASTSFYDKLLCLWDTQEPAAKTAPTACTVNHPVE